ncbi:MAG: 1-acyl-sn-glycerol-3-phosphate acyltransferase [Anaerolineales bacterium]|nr:1-acyl-sn-glycerol-3-phosphate acyltransferase [Chloroflexota bacterium]MBL6981334.1 1-acyl-sn-glycerol-3-phosphate acyltransferase [Anaerolineales bacterium]
MSTKPPKPISSVYRPELVRLPELTLKRRLVRRLIHVLLRLVVRLVIKLDVRGREYFPEYGPLLVVGNHLGDADVVVGMALSLVPVEILGKIELYDFPIAGWLMEAYGTIWLHRGSPDRRAIRAALQGLVEGRIVAIAPEGRESTTGSLEEGTSGAAYLALKTDVPILPVAITGTENWRIYGNLKRLRRTKVSVTVGTPFRLETKGDRRQQLKDGTDQIMESMAQLLPPEYQGVYSTLQEKEESPFE